MKNVYFNLYRDAVIKLSRSMVIKFSDVADQINLELENSGHVVNYEDPTTWKYYLNISGLEHHTNKTMYIRSSDTLETIEFSKVNLKIHRATLREIYPGSLQYNNLVRKYPDQEQLIRGILHPVNINDAIEAENGKILYYDSELVESNEDRLVEDIQTWIYTFIFRWYNPNYALIDDFNLTTFLGNLYSKLPVNIMLLRFRNVNTIKAHSYYVREYLASNGHLDDFFEYLDLRQRLWLYRNIRYINRNSGKQEIWDSLVDNILTPKGIPLVSYTLEQNSKNLLIDTSNEVNLLRHDVNFDITQDDQYDTTISEVLNREDVLARDNQKLKVDAEYEIIDTVGSDKYSSLPTKVLDSEVMDRSNSSVKTLNSVLLSQWLYMASTDKYRAYVNIPHPRTGEFMVLSVKDVYILMIYAYGKAYDLDLKMIPKVIAYEVLRDPLPNFQELRAKVDSRLISDNLITSLQDMVEPSGAHISTESFYRDCANIHRNYLKQWEAYSFNEGSRGRAYCEQIVNSHYMHIKCTLAEPFTTFEDHFKEAAIHVENLTTLELQQLVSECFSIGTGANLVKSITLAEVQRELLSLMGRLSSYPLQYLRNVSYTDFHILGSTTTRLDSVHTDGRTTYAGNYISVGTNFKGSESWEDIAVNETDIMDGLQYDYEMSSEHKIDPTINVIDITYRDYGYLIPMGTMGIRNAHIVIDKNPDETNDLEIFN